MTIPDKYKKICEFETVKYCPYLIHPSCPATCNFAKEIKASSNLLTKGIGKVVQEVKHKDGLY